MAYQNIPGIGVNLFVLDQLMDRIVVGQVVSVFIAADDGFDHGRLDKGKQVEVYITIFVLQYHFLDLFFRQLGRHPDHMYLLTLKDVTEHIDPRRTVVVAANEHDLGIRDGLRQA